MKVQTSVWNGTTATIYLLQCGEKIVRHRHPVDHTTMTLWGYSKTEIFYDREVDTTCMVWGAPGITLPANVDHEITALEDDTIVLNMIAGEFPKADADIPRAPDGGVILADGSIARP